MEHLPPVNVQAPVRLLASSLAQPVAIAVTISVTALVALLVDVISRF
jgi:hypothetical protein